MIAKLIQGRLTFVDTDEGHIQLEDEYGRTIDLTLDANTPFPLDAISLVGQDVEVVCVDGDKFKDIYLNRQDE